MALSIPGASDGSTEITKRQYWELVPANHRFLSIGGLGIKTTTPHATQDVALARMINEVYTLVVDPTEKPRGKPEHQYGASF
ncbi:hypothetical protein OPQ81_010995 [Rhizoctonia solani]|nr:hypothetical protein OPQ81_010995 [Rhizoctonia solani]